MEPNFSCELFFDFNEEELRKFLNYCLKNLGFSPKIMYVYIGFDEQLEDIPYDEAIIFSSLKKGATTITIKNKMYDDKGVGGWFRISNSQAYNVLSLTWNNDNLDFLLVRGYLNYFLQSVNFIYGNCCENYDKYLQSLEKEEHFISTDPTDIYKVKKIEKQIDVSEHWGRSKIFCGIELVAGPLMWFGEKFYKIIPKEKLLSFNYSSLVKLSSAEIILMKLFDVYDSAAKPENRNKQKEFWIFFNLADTINKYEDANKVESGQLMKALFLQISKRGKK